MSSYLTNTVKGSVPLSGFAVFALESSYLLCSSLASTCSQHPSLAMLFLSGSALAALYLQAKCTHS